MGFHPDGPSTAEVSSMECHSNLAKPRLLDLPSETISEVLTYLNPADLAKLMITSRALRDYSAAQLYRRLSHEFSDSATQVREMSVEKLAGILETLATSDFNYAAYIKEISLRVARSNDLNWMRAQEKLTHQFKYDASCGRFLNTLFLGAIKKILALETFHWDIKVQLSPSIFSALGKLSSLQDLRVRMHTGRSLHAPVHHPPLPSWPGPSPAPAPPPPPPPAASSPHPHHHGPPPSSATGLPYAVHSTAKMPEKRTVSNPPRTFSHIQRLKSLAVLDMESLEYIDEIAECILASSTTLKSLKLSFSHKLTSKARKSTVLETSDTESDSHDDDDIYDPDSIPLPPPPPPAVMQSLFEEVPASNPNNDATIRNERLAQEKALSRLFGLEKEALASKRVLKVTEKSIASAEQEPLIVSNNTIKAKLDRAFVHELYGIVCDLAQGKATLAGGSNAIKTVDRLQKAAIKFLEGYAKADSYLAQVLATSYGKPENSHPQSSSKGGNLTSDPVSDPSDSASSADSQKDSHKDTTQSLADPNSSPSTNPETHTEAVASCPSTPPIPSVDRVHNPEPANQMPINPVKNEIEKRLTEIVDMEHPDALSEGEDQEFIEHEETEAQGSVPNWPVDEAIIFPSLREGLVPKISAKGKEPIRGSQTPISNTSEEFKNDDQPSFGDMSGEQAIQEYIRLSHGIALESLSIQLIPLKTSVICRAVNVWSLKHISLINVGPQRTFWAMLTQLNKSNPLQLASIHTDDVTHTLLAFIGSLDFVDELFLSERHTSSRTDGSAPKPAVNIEEIRGMMLAKHIKHLKRLMLRNDVDSSWNLNRQTTKLITRSGSELVELMVAVDSANFHLMMHYIQHLRSLVALHILFFNSEYCAALLREIRLCAIDNIIHFPSLKVQYVAVSHMVNGPVATKASRIVKALLPAKLDSMKLDVVTMSVLSKVLLSSTSKNIKVKPIPAGGSQSFPAEGSLNAVPWVDDSDDDFSGLSQWTLLVDAIELHDTIGIKVWQREIYYSIL
ncbi:hypothetical protein PRK78_000289 [Emydomyces testavorans]|uniref:F-box domain-containing protein n=1 Tax=Emydomyces testavorans TaxID=2070801 RepID=A0AAF0DAR3_9EURO|nr:hypothetical protein PRK78_000289 [Emydomyces testavorans]